MLTNFLFSKICWQCPTVLPLHLKQTFPLWRTCQRCEEPTGSTNTDASEMIMPALEKRNTSSIGAWPNSLDRRPPTYCIVTPLFLILLQFQVRRQKSSPPSLWIWRSKRTLEDETSIQIRTRHCSNRGCKNFCFLNLFVLKTLVGQSKVWTVWKSEL